MKVLFLDKSLLCVQPHKALLKGTATVLQQQPMHGSADQQNFVVFSFQKQVVFFTLTSYGQRSSTNINISWQHAQTKTKSYSKCCRSKETIVRSFFSSIVTRLCKASNKLLSLKKKNEFPLAMIISYRMNNYVFKKKKKEQETARGVRTGTQIVVISSKIMNAREGSTSCLSSHWSNRSRLPEQKRVGEKHFFISPGQHP